MSIDRAGDALVALVWASETLCVSSMNDEARMVRAGLALNDERMTKPKTKAGAKLLCEF